MRYVRRIFFIFIATLSFGVMGNLLLAQDAEATETPDPLPIDCSPSGLRALNDLIERRFKPGFDSDTDSIVNNLYFIGSLYERIALECGYKPDDYDIARLLEEMVNRLALRDQLIGSDSLAALQTIEDLVGDPERGDRLYFSQERTTLGHSLACMHCHTYTYTVNSVAPLTKDIWDQTLTSRLQEPALLSYTPEFYIVESILEPDAFIVDGYADVMPHQYGEYLSAQDLADLVAYLHSFSSTSEEN